MKRDLLNLQDLSGEELLELLKLTSTLKKKKKILRNDLKGKTIGLVFQKPSNRTRVSFEVGVYQLGGQCLYLGPDEINLGVRETTHDVAKTLSRYLDGIVARTFKHQDITDLAKYATIPVINGLSDLHHPCQALADIFSIQEKFGKFTGVTLAYVGDGNNNVCHSLMIACAKGGIHVRVASPKGYEPKSGIIEITKKYAKATKTIVTITEDPEEAVQNANVIYADVFVSMGQENEAAKRLNDLAGYQVNEKLIKLANKNHIFMHCLPAHRGQEVTDSVIDGKHSIVFDQAENRLHVQKAVLIFLMSNAK